VRFFLGQLHSASMSSVSRRGAIGHFEKPETGAPTTMSTTEITSRIKSGNFRTCRSEFDAAKSRPQELPSRPGRSSKDAAWG
jgi:hypothetical protein